MIALAVGLVFDLPAVLQRAIPDYTTALQDSVADSSQVADSLNLGGIVTDQNRLLDQGSNGASELEAAAPLRTSPESLPG